MFNNIGSKLKTTASVFFWVGFIFSIVYGIVTIEGLGLLVGGTDNLTEIEKLLDSDIADAIETAQNILGIIRMVGGWLLSWLISALLYGFGQLIEDTKESTRILQINREESWRKKATRSAQSTEPYHQWRCDDCGKLRTKTPCEHCGKE